MRNNEVNWKLLQQPASKLHVIEREEQKHRGKKHEEDHSHGSSHLCMQECYVIMR